MTFDQYLTEVNQVFSSLYPMLCPVKLKMASTVKFQNLAASSVFNVRHFVCTQKSCVPRSCTDVDLDDVILNISTSHVDGMMNDFSDDKHRANLDSDPAGGLGRCEY